jgi:PilZ domain-containing protein
MTALPVELLAEAGATPLHRRDRRETNLRADATRDDGTVVSVTLIDLSYDGCGIDSPMPLRPGETLTLAVHRRGTVTATVRWTAGGKAGLVFAVEPEPAVDEPAQAPRLHERIAVDAEVALRRAGKLHFQVHVFDVSPDGCKAEFVERPEVGEQVWIKFTGIEALEAQVCWVAGAKSGIKFARPIHPAVFDLLLQRMR